MVALTQTKLHGVYCTMKTRCYNPNAEKYPRYGGRGIKVCDEWKDNFLRFRYWALQSGYKSGLQLNRIDNDGNYSPDNCEWVTSQRQQNNRSNTLFITAFGETKSRMDWVRDSRCVVKPATLRRRLKLGWLPETAITTNPEQGRNQWR